MGDFLAGFGKAFVEAGGKIVKPVGDAAEALKNAAKSNCYLENDTKYRVEIVDYDGTRTLSPGETQHNFLIKGPFSLDLVMIFNNGKDVKINFPEHKFQDRTHKMSNIFADAIREYES